MMRYILMFMFAFVSCLTMSGQTKVSAQEQAQVLQKFNKTSAALKSMQCDFVQTKKIKLLKNEMQAKGLMYFV